MSAREIIARAISEDISGGWIEEYDETAVAVLKALTSAGYRILVPGELDPETLEEASKVCDARLPLYDFAQRNAVKECRNSILSLNSPKDSGDEG